MGQKQLILTSISNITFKGRLENLGKGANRDKIALRSNKPCKIIVLISILLGSFSKINKRPGPNKDVLGGKLTENNKNVLDYYQAD